MSCHVDQDIAAIVRQQPLTPRHLLPDPIRQQAYEVLDRDFVPAIVDLDVVAVEVDSAVGVGVHGAGERITRVACHVVRQHEDDLGVWNAEALHGAVEGEHVCEMAVVEPEARGRDQDSPIAGVFCSDGGRGQEGREEQRELKETVELHGVKDLGCTVCVHVVKVMEIVA